MYNKYIFINNNRRKKQKELEEKKKLENTQISFDALMKMSKTSEINKIASDKKKNFKENTFEQINSNSNSTNFNKLRKGRNLNQFVDDYVIVDIETTGLSPVFDDIIEIGAIKVKNNEMVEKYNGLININRRLPPFITNLTGITNNMLKKGKLPETVLKEFIEFVGNEVIVGHNVNFDLSFLCNKCKEYIDYNLNNDYIDTLYLARRLIPNSINYKLGTLANMFNISYEGAHRGLKDVEITYEVYNKLRRIK